MNTDEIERATAPARWLLQLGADGIPLTQTGALARNVVRDAALRWPGWWNAEVFGPPNREADLPVLEALRHGLLRMRLLRRRGRRLFATVRGGAMADQSLALMPLLEADLQGADEVRAVIAAAVADGFRAGAHPGLDELAQRAVVHVQQRGWRRRDGEPLSSRDLAWDVADVLRLGEAYGLFEQWRDARPGDLPRFRFAPTPAGRSMLCMPPTDQQAADVLVFDADLLNAPGVGARVAVRAHQHLTALHDAIQEAFGWWDDHLYSFWTDNRFWSRDASAEITSPVVPDEAPRTADIPISDLGLRVGARIAYLFDFGDEWRVALTLRELTEPDELRYPRVVKRTGTAPPQYAGADDENPSA